MSAATLWDQFVMHTRMIQVAQQTVRDKAAAQVFRDEAAAALAGHVDRLIVTLDKMSDQQLLVQIGQILRQRGV